MEDMLVLRGGHGNPQVLEERVHLLLVQRALSFLFSTTATLRIYDRTTTRICDRSLAVKNGNDP